MKKVIDGILELCGYAPVALGGEEDERVVGGYVVSPDAGVFVGVELGGIHNIKKKWLVEDGEVVVCEVDEGVVGAGA